MKAQASIQSSAPLCPREVFKKTFAPMINATGRITTRQYDGESIATFSEFMHRYNLCNSYTSEPNLDYKFNPWEPYFYKTDCPFLVFLKMFTFHRGSVRYKLQLNTNDTSSPWFVIASNWSDDVMQNDGYYTHTTNGVAIQQSDLTLFTEVETPYYCCFPLQSFFYPSEFIDQPQIAFQVYTQSDSSPTGNITGTIYIAAGDDWSCGSPLPPPMYQLTAPSLKTGTKVVPNLEEKKKLAIFSANRNVKKNNNNRNTRL